MLNLESLINDIEKDCATEEEALYKLLELAIAVTDHGYICMKADHIKEMNISMGCVTIGLDTQYQCVCISFDYRGFLMYDKKLLKSCLMKLKKGSLNLTKESKKQEQNLQTKYSTNQ